MKDLKTDKFRLEHSSNRAGVGPTDVLVAIGHHLEYQGVEDHFFARTIALLTTIWEKGRLNQGVCLVLNALITFLDRGLVDGDGQPILGDDGQPVQTPITKEAVLAFLESYATRINRYPPDRFVASVHALHSKRKSMFRRSRGGAILNYDGKQVSCHRLIGEVQTEALEEALLAGDIEAARRAYGIESEDVLEYEQDRSTHADLEAINTSWSLQRPPMIQRRLRRTKQKHGPNLINLPTLQ